MTFKNLIRSIQVYLHIQDAGNKELIKDFINESILDFIRRDDWLKLHKVYELTLDDTNNYDLTAITEKFYSEISLLTEGGDKMTKLDYKNYLRATDKTGYWSIVGNTVYVTGTDTTASLVYLAIGENYPLAVDDHEVPATEFYWDIIKQMVIVRMLDYIGDETIAKEEQNLEKKIIVLRKSENRTKQQGKMAYANRTE